MATTQDAGWLLVLVLRMGGDIQEADLVFEDLQLTGLENKPSKIYDQVWRALDKVRHNG